MLVLFPRRVEHVTDGLASEDTPDALPDGHKGSDGHQQPRAQLEQRGVLPVPVHHEGASDPESHNDEQDDR